MACGATGSCGDRHSDGRALGRDGCESVAPGAGTDELGPSGREARLRRIRHKVMVMSGKGGVGKSTVAANLAMLLRSGGMRVGLLDVDIHGPTIPKMLGLEDVSVGVVGGLMQPATAHGVKVMSIGFLLRDRDEAVIWRGPMKMGAIKQFLEEVEWGDLDYLVIDSPPGTGDEPLSACQLAAPIDGAVIVTTPQDVATADVRKSIMFCRRLGLPVLGVVENMSGFVCPTCGTVTDIFRTGGGEKMAADMGVAFLGRIPLDPAVGVAGDSGRPVVGGVDGGAASEAFRQIAAPVFALSGAGTTGWTEEADEIGGEQMMKIAIPVAEGRLCMHFGHCEQFALVDVNESTRGITGMTLVTPPPHEPGVLPRWLHERGATVIIAGGMGQRAQGLFAENGITVVVGAAGDVPERVAEQYLAGTLATGENACDH